MYAIDKFFAKVGNLKHSKGRFFWGSKVLRFYGSMVLGVYGSEGMGC
jgi:hypothetical protein